MKKFILIITFLLLSICFINIIQAEEKIEKKIEAITAKFTEGKFWVYENRGSRVNHYVPAEWAGDYGDIQIDTAWKENAYSTPTCIKIDYSAESKQGNEWAGIFWNRNISSAGMIIFPGFNLKEAQKMVFYIRGEQGGEIISDLGLGHTSKSNRISIGPLSLSKEWQKHEIALEGKKFLTLI